MNGSIAFAGICGQSNCLDVSVDGNTVRIGEIQLAHLAHIFFLAGKTVMSMLAGAKLYVDSKVYSVDKLVLPSVKITSYPWEVPYKLQNVVFVSESIDWNPDTV